MPNRKIRLVTLFQRYLNNAVSPEEYQELLDLLNTDTLSEELSAELKDLWAQSAISPVSLPNAIWDEKIDFLLEKLHHENIPSAPVKKIANWNRLKWAAVIISPVLMFSGYYFSKSSPQKNKDIVVTSKPVNGLMPGGNKAVLMLADGASILLDSSSAGTITSQGNTSVVQLNTGQLVYKSSNTPAPEILYNTLSTPRGGQYQLTLADGTRVWLNSASFIRFPAAFKGITREVEINGEAYFEVAKNANRPFKVHIKLEPGKTETVEVLGTHFNINAYNDEADVRTTLFEGSVQVNHSTGVTRIKPGQQLRSGNGQPAILKDADVEEVIAWKEGVFQFEDADIKFVMRQIARWYNIEVVYEGTISRHFNGTISKNIDILKVLKMLELTGEVTFDLEGRKVVVRPQ